MKNEIQVLGYSQTKQVIAKKKSFTGWADAPVAAGETQEMQKIKDLLQAELAHLREEIREQIRAELTAEIRRQVMEDLKEKGTLDYNPKSDIVPTQGTTKGEETAKPKCRYIHHSFAKKENRQILKLMAEKYPAIKILVEQTKADEDVQASLKKSFRLTTHLSRNQLLRLSDRLDWDICNPFLRTLIAQNKLKEAQKIVKKYNLKEEKTILLEKLSQLTQRPVTEEQLRWAYVYLN